MLADDDDELLATAVKSQGSQQPAWMRTLFERCREWLGELPEVCPFTIVCFIPVLTWVHFQKFNTLTKQTAEHQDPLYRLFAREGSIGRKLLEHVRRDLQDIIKICQGELKQTNHLRTLMSTLTKGMY